MRLCDWLMDGMSDVSWDVDVCVSWFMVLAGFLSCSYVCDDV